MGIVTKTEPDASGTVRNVVVKTQMSQLQRASH